MNVRTREEEKSSRLSIASSSSSFEEHVRVHRSGRKKAIVLTLTAPFSPIRYETSPGSTHTDNSAGKFSKISPIGTPLSRAATSSTTSIGSPVLRHRNAEPCGNGARVKNSVRDKKDKVYKGKQKKKKEEKLRKTKHKNPLNVSHDHKS